MEIINGPDILFNIATASFHAFCIFNHVRAMGSFPTRSAAFSASLSLSAGRSLHYYYSRSILHPVKIDWWRDTHAW